MNKHLLMSLTALAMLTPALCHAVYRREIIESMCALKDTNIVVARMELYLDYEVTSSKPSKSGAYFELSKVSNRDGIDKPILLEVSHGIVFTVGFPTFSEDTFSFEQSNTYLTTDAIHTASATLKLGGIQAKKSQAGTLYVEGVDRKGITYGVTCTAEIAHF